MIKCLTVHHNESDHMMPSHTLKVFPPDNYSKDHTLSIKTHVNKVGKLKFRAWYKLLQKTVYKNVNTTFYCHRCRTTPWLGSSCLATIGDSKKLLLIKLCQKAKCLYYRLRKKDGQKVKPKHVAPWWWAAV